MIKVGDEINLNGSIYEVTRSKVMDHSPSLYLMNLNGVNNKIFIELEIIDMFDFYTNECNIQNGFNRESFNRYSSIGLFPEVHTLEELQRLINILNEIIPYGTYKGYQRAQKLKLLGND